jgi:dihydrofolate synthase/folylpolyglutamate synthase
MMSQELQEWLVSHYGKEQFEPGLERIKKILTPYLPSLQKIKTVTVAGTNGKGETTLRLSHLLSEKSHTVWTSPHVKSITERFRSEKGEIALSELEDLIFQCHQEVVKAIIRLSFYEFLFFVFCFWSLKKNPEFLLLEVGLGGRWDAVNVLDADLVLLTSISRDHQEFLGKRYDGILKEKLGVTRSGKTLISYVDLMYLRQRVAAFAHQENVKLLDLETIGKFPSCQFSERNQLLAYAAYIFLMQKDLNLIGAYRPKGPLLENRGEIFQEVGNWTFYGSHNVDGVRKLIQFLHSANYNFTGPPFDIVLTSFSKRSEQDLEVMLRMLKQGKLGKVLVTSFHHPKAASGEVLRRLSCQEGLDFVGDMEGLIQQYKHQKVLVLGSYYFLGVLQGLLRS